MLPTYKISEQANWLREEVGLGVNDRVTDILDCVKQGQFTYQEDRFGNDFSAFSKSLGGGKYHIGFNLDHYWSKKFFNFTIGHELAHVYLPHHRKILESTPLHRSKSEYRSGDDIEKEADAFSINFLAPRDQFLKASKAMNFTAENIQALSDDFHVSTYAAALRFIELTDLACTLLVCNNKGMVEYEKRSDLMKISFRLPFVYNKAIDGDTVTGSFISGKSKASTGKAYLVDWYDDLDPDFTGEESVIDLGYNGKFLALVTPDLISSAEPDDY